MNLSILNKRFISHGVSLIGMMCLVFAMGLFPAPYGAISVVAQAQGSSSSSWDFETGDLGNWKPQGTVAVVGDSIDSLTDNAMHTVAQGKFSAKIGDEVPWGGFGGTDQFSSLENTVTVPQDVSSPVLQFSYAVVANDPPDHPETEKPYFQLEITDLNTGEQLPGSVMKYTNQNSSDWYLGNPPADLGFSSSTFSQLSGDVWVFIPWKHEVVDLSGREGHNIQIRFTARDCNYGAHAAYGYLDNVRVGSEITLPALPQLIKTPVQAPSPPEPTFLQSFAGLLEAYHLWPWCLLLPLLLLLAFLLYKFWPRSVKSFTGGPPPESRKTERREPPKGAGGGVTKK